MKLCHVKVGKSDACVRPLFANSVTNVLLEHHCNGNSFIHTQEKSIYLQAAYHRVTQEVKAHKLIIGCWLHSNISQIIQDVESRNTSGDRCVHCCFCTTLISCGIYLGYTAKVKAASSKKEAKGGLLKKQLWLTAEKKLELIFKMKYIYLKCTFLRVDFAAYQLAYQWYLKSV